MKQIFIKRFILLAIIIFIIFILWESISFQFEFNERDEDLQNYSSSQLIEMKNSINKSLLSPASLKFRFMIGIGFFVPIIVIITGYNYEKIKENFLKFNIGKNNKYKKNLNKNKILLSLIPVISVIIVYGILIIIGIISNGPNNFNIDSENLINNNSILKTIFKGEMGYAIFVILFVSIGTFINSIFAFSLIDKLGYIKGVLAYLIILWVISISLFNILANLDKDIRIMLRNFVPIQTLMGISETSSTLISVMKSYTTLLVSTILLNIFNKIEVK